MPGQVDLCTGRRNDQLCRTGRSHKVWIQEPVVGRNQEVPRGEALHVGLLQNVDVKIKHLRILNGGEYRLNTFFSCSLFPIKYSPKE